MFLLSIIFSLGVTYADCKNDLLKILGEAKTSVKANFKVSEPCYIAAMNGNKDKPGCYDIVKLSGTLKKHVESAIAKCNGVCKTEGMQKSCLDITQQKKFVKIGITGVESLIKNNGLAKDAVYKEDKEPENMPVEI